MTTSLALLMMRSRSSYLMPCFYRGCIGSSIWMGSGLGFGIAAMDNVVSPKHKARCSIISQWKDTVQAFPNDNIICSKKKVQNKQRVT